MKLTPPRQKVDRDEVFLEYTKSICPVCKVVVDAEVNVRDNKVFLRKRCPEHGIFEALVYSDAELYFASLRFNKPGTIPLETQTEVDDGCPLDCGLCPEHKQHACLGIIEVNSGCNLDCPVCFADSGHQPDGFSLTLEQVETGLDAFVAAEGDPEVVMFSGGEPTIHPLILDFLRLATDKGIGLVTLNTNGIRLAHDRRFVAALADAPKPRIYLQFDGLRGEHPPGDPGPGPAGGQAPRRSTTAPSSAWWSSWWPPSRRGLNEHEIGGIVRFGMAPSGGAGGRLPARHPLRPPRRVRPPQPGHQRRRHPRPGRPAPRVVPGSPTSSPSRAASPPAGRSPTPSSTATASSPSPGSSTWRTTSTTSPTGSCPTPPSASAGEAVERLGLRRQPATDAAQRHQLGCVACGIDSPAALDSWPRRSFMIVIQDFQDPYTLNVKQLMKCCVEEITPDGRIIPFCAYNSVGYREQVREQLSGVAVPTIVPNAHRAPAGPDHHPLRLQDRRPTATTATGRQRTPPTSAERCG